MAAGALVLKVREGGRTENMHALVAAGVNAEGYREILGLHLTTSESAARVRRRQLLAHPAVSLRA